MTHPEIVDRIESYIRENFLYTRPDFELAPDRPLMESGVIDSMGVLELIDFLHDSLGVTVEDAEITEENLGTLDTIARLVGRKRADRAREHAA